MRMVAIQIDQAAVAEKLVAHLEIPADQKFSRRWIAWGVAATVPLVFATYVMVTKT